MEAIKQTETVFEQNTIINNNGILFQRHVNAKKNI